jgi:Alpha/beta hydrolase domain
MGLSVARRAKLSHQVRRTAAIGAGLVVLTAGGLTSADAVPVGAGLGPAVGGVPVALGAGVRPVAGVPLAPAAAPRAVGPAAAGLPTVTGPIAETAASYPFGAADHERVPEELARVGYVEREYFVSGLANVYDWPAPGPAVVRTAGAPYTTRILVRRPAAGTRFSGNVVVEPLNPSNLFDLNLGWALMHEQLVRAGDIWVGVTVKPVSVQTLKAFDPVRYGPLSMANPLPLDDPANCATVPADSSRGTENGLAWDIYSQVAALLRSSSAANPVGYARPGSPARPARRLYGFGYSQTGGYLYDYINAVAPLVVRQTGRSPYDGYLVAVAGGAFVGNVPINQCATVPPVTDPRFQLSNVGVPVIHVMSQSDYLRGITARRPDSDVPSDRYRQYEMAGAGHATPDELNFAAAPADIEKGGRAVPPMSCNEGPRSRFPSHIFFDAIQRNLDLWVRRGIAPPHGSPIVVQNGAGVTDSFGNVIGGLRSPYLDVPTSTWFGSSTGPSFCGIAGHEVPFSRAQLAALYPSHGGYVRAVARDVATLVGQRFITDYDGAALIREAVAAQVP